jgi:hypothetical protein
MRLKFLVIILSMVVIGGCSWVELTADGKNVRVMGRYDVAGCRTLGKTTATVADTVAGLKRKEHIVKENLETLARNAAATMGGDTIVPDTKIEKGKQTFDVYKCMR